MASYEVIKQFVDVWGLIIAIGLAVIILGVRKYLRKKKAQPKQNPGFIEHYARNSRQGEDMPGLEISSYQDAKPNLDKELENDLDKWRDIRSKLYGRRGEIVQKGNKLKVEIIELDKRIRFLDDVLAKAGKDEIRK